MPSFRRLDSFSPRTFLEETPYGRAALSGSGSCIYPSTESSCWSVELAVASRSRESLIQSAHEDNQRNRQPDCRRSADRDDAMTVFLQPSVWDQLQTENPPQLDAQSSTPTVFGLPVRVTHRSPHGGASHPRSLRPGSIFSEIVGVKGGAVLRATRKGPHPRLRGHGLTSSKAPRYRSKYATVS